MSYILDALRKADAERESGRIPGIHAQQVLLTSAEADSSGRWTRLPWIIVGLLAALVAALAWNMLGRDAVPRSADSHATPSQSAAPTTPSPAEAASVAAAAASMALAAAMQATAAASAVSAAAAKPVALAHPKKPKPVARKPAAADAPVPGAQAAKALPAAPDAQSMKAPASMAEKRVYLLNELPPEIRQQLPALAVGGASYSTSPTSRMLIINGQVFHEGDRLTPDLSLRQIKLKSAVLDFKGYRYEIKY